MLDLPGRTFIISTWEPDAQGWSPGAVCMTASAHTSSAVPDGQLQHKQAPGEEQPDRILTSDRLVAKFSPQPIRWGMTRDFCGRGGCSQEETGGQADIWPCRRDPIMSTRDEERRGCHSPETLRIIRLFIISSQQYFHVHVAALKQFLLLRCDISVFNLQMQ